MAWINNDGGILLRSPPNGRGRRNGGSLGGVKRQKFTFGVWKQAEPEIVGDSLGLDVMQLGPRAPTTKLTPLPHPFRWRTMPLSCHSSGAIRSLGLIKFRSVPLRNGHIPTPNEKSWQNGLKLHRSLPKNVLVGIKVSLRQAGGRSSGCWRQPCGGPFFELSFSFFLRVDWLARGLTKCHVSPGAKGDYLTYFLCSLCSSRSLLT